MTSAAVDAGLHVVVEGCVIAPIGSALKTGKDNMHSIVLPSTPRGPMYLVIPFRDVPFPHAIPPVVA